jgi:hypothetical protein
MNCWGIRIYLSKSRFSLTGGLFVYMELLSGHEKIITKSGISLNVGTLNRGFTVFYLILTNIEFVEQISVKSSSIKFCQNLSSGSQVPLSLLHVFNNKVQMCLLSVPC